MSKRKVEIHNELARDIVRLRPWRKHWGKPQKLGWDELLQRDKFSTSIFIRRERWLNEHHHAIYSKSLEHHMQIYIIQVILFHYIVVYCTNSPGIFNVSFNAGLKLLFDPSGQL